MRRASASPREGSKISSQTPDEPLVPEEGFGPLWLPEIRGFWPGIAILAIAVTVAWVLRPFLASPLFSAVEHFAYPGNWMFRWIAYGLDVLVGVVVPSLAALVMLWVAFIRVELRDRYLWSAIMILSAGMLASLLGYLVPHQHYRLLRTASDAIDATLVISAVAYATVYCALRNGMQRPDLGTITMICMAVVFALPLALGYVSWATALCSIFVAAGIWSIGVSIADSVGFDVYGPD